jgi:DNA mismatch repair protein MutS2
MAGIRCCLAKAVAVVPFSLGLASEERTLLVSGPNTGGKTVFLKALGLISAMSQAGIPAPVGAESRVPVFDDVLRRRRRRAIDRGEPLHFQRSPEEPQRDPAPRDARLRSCSSTSWGSGTDPQEGAALGWAILESLTARGSTTLASTHLGQLKELATQVPGRR